MKVPLHVVKARREKLEKLVATHRYLPLQDVCKRLGISEATARRDLAALQREGRVTRTHGGALSDFNDRFPSYSERHRRAAKSKAELARTALAAIQPGRTYFFDSGTTVSYLAEALAANPPGPLRILTVNLPVAELLSAHKELEVYVTGGQILRRQSVLLGPGVVKTIEGWSFDAAFFSAEGMDAEGLWNSQLAIISYQHAVVRRARHNVFLLDRSKLGSQAAHFLLPWAAVDCVLTDASAGEMRGLSPEAARAHWRPGAPPPFAFSPAEKTEELPVHYL